MPEPGFAAEAARFRHRDETDGVEPVLLREGFGLGECLARDNGHLHGIAGAGPVEHQIVHVVGRAPFERGGNLTPPVAGAGAGRLDRRVEDLAVRDDHLGGKTLRFQPGRIAPQIRDRTGKIGLVGRHCAQFDPALRRPVQQGDPVMRQCQGKIRFHVAGLAHDEAGEGVRGGDGLSLQQEIAE
ncbi:MAG: hypothetical protein ACK4KW_01600 [Gemmobacter sp.]